MFFRLPSAFHYIITNCRGDFAKLMRNQHKIIFSYRKHIHFFRQRLYFLILQTLIYFRKPKRIQAASARIRSLRFLCQRALHFRLYHKNGKFIIFTALFPDIRTDSSHRAARLRKCPEYLPHGGSFHPYFLRRHAQPGF